MIDSLVVVSFFISNDHFGDGEMTDGHFAKQRSVLDKDCTDLLEIENASVVFGFCRMEDACCEVLYLQIHESSISNIFHCKNGSLYTTSGRFNFIMEFMLLLVKEPPLRIEHKKRKSGAPFLL